MPRNGTKNLIPFTKETAKEMGRKGAIASAKSKRKKKSFKQLLQLICSTPLNLENKTKIKKTADSLGVDLDDITYGLMVNLAQVQKAISEKDTRAAEYVRDTLGEKPLNQVEVTNDVEDLTPLAEMLKPTEEEGKDDE